MKKHKYLFHYITAPGWGIVIASIVLKVSCGLLPAIYIQIYAALVDSISAAVSSSRSISDDILRILPAFLIFGVLNYCSGSMANYLSARLQTQLSVRLRLMQIDKISRLSYFQIENKDSYELIGRVRKGTPDNFVNGFFSWLSLIELILRILSITWTVFCLQSSLSLIMVLLFLPMILVSLRTGKQDYEAVRIFEKTWRKLEDYEKILTKKEYVNERTIFGFQPWLIHRWQTGYESTGKMLMAIYKRSYIGIKLSSSVITVSSLLMILSLIWGVQAGSVSIGNFSAVSAELLALSSNLSWSLASALKGIAQCTEFMRDVREYEELSERTEGSVQKKSVREIHFQNVSFHYPGTDRYILKHMDLNIDTTKSYAIVGANGAGKTTLTKLILGLYPEYEGNILLDGTELRQIQSCSGLFSVAFQDFAKYQISLRDNVTLGNSNLSDKEIINLLEHLRFPLEQERFPGGLDTAIGYLSQENTNLSLGQWQKLILARAVAHGGKFFLLDEPTASLDPPSESEVYNNFLNVIHDRPSLIITHRLGAARLADCILVINDGRIVEQGNHEELLEKKGLYAEMFETQKGWYV